MINKENESGCQVEKHHPSCPCKVCTSRNCDSCDIRLTTQHEIPVSIGRFINISYGNLDKHTIKASQPCHSREDKRVEYILEIIKMLKKKEGIIPTEKDVLEMRKLGMFREEKPENMEIKKPNC